MLTNTDEYSVKWPCLTYTCGWHWDAKLTHWRWRWLIICCEITMLTNAVWNLKRACWRSADEGNMKWTRIWMSNYEMNILMNTLLYQIGQAISCSHWIIREMNIPKTMHERNEYSKQYKKWTCWRMLWIGHRPGNEYGLKWIGVVYSLNDRSRLEPFNYAVDSLHKSHFSQKASAA